MASRSADLVLEIVAGPLKGTTITKRGSTFRIGRTGKSSLQVKDPSVSEKHAELKWRDGTWCLRDLGSSNGTQVNGRSVEDEFVALKNGDEVRLGTETIARVQIPTEETVEENDENITVQQFLEAECERLGQTIKGRAEQMADGLRRAWNDEKARLLST